MPAAVTSRAGERTICRDSDSLQLMHISTADMAGHFHFALEAARKRLGRPLLPPSRTSSLVHLAAMGLLHELPGLTVATAWDNMSAYPPLLMEVCSAGNSRPALEFIRKAMS